MSIPAKKVQTSLDESMNAIQTELKRILEKVPNIQTVVRKNRSNEIETLFISPDKSLVEEVVYYFTTYYSIPITMRQFNSQDEKWKNTFVACIFKAKLSDLFLINTLSLIKLREDKQTMEQALEYHQEFFKIQPSSDLEEFIKKPKNKGWIETLIGLIFHSILDFVFESESGKNHFLSRKVIVPLRMGIESGLYQILDRYLKKEENPNLLEKLKSVYVKHSVMAKKLSDELKNLIKPSTSDPQYFDGDISSVCIREKIVLFEENSKIETMTFDKKGDPILLKCLNKITKKITDATWNGVANIMGSEYFLKSNNGAVLEFIKESFQEKQNLTVLYGKVRKELKIINPNIEDLEKYKELQFPDPDFLKVEDTKIKGQRFEKAAEEGSQAALSKLFEAKRMKPGLLLSCANQFELLYKIFNSIKNFLVLKLYEENNNFFQQAFSENPLAEFPLNIYTKIVQGVIEYMFSAPNINEVIKRQKMLEEHVDDIASKLFQGFLSTLKSSPKLGEGYFLSIPDFSLVSDIVKSIMVDIENDISHKATSHSSKGAKRKL